MYVLLVKPNWTRRLITLAFNKQIWFIACFAFCVSETLFAIGAAFIALAIEREVTVWAWTHTVAVEEVEFGFACYALFAIETVFTVVYAWVAYAVVVEVIVATVIHAFGVLELFSADAFFAGCQVGFA